VTRWLPRDRRLRRIRGDRRRGVEGSGGGAAYGRRFARAGGRRELGPGALPRPISAGCAPRCRRARGDARDRDVLVKALVAPRCQGRGRSGGDHGPRSAAVTDYVRPLAELIVRFGANVQPGQIVAVGSEPGKEELTRAIAEVAYAQGAKFVDLAVFDMHLKRA